MIQIVTDIILVRTGEDYSAILLIDLESRAGNGFVFS